MTGPEHYAEAVRLAENTGLLITASSDDVPEGIAGALIDAARTTAALAVFGTPTTFYDGSPEHELVKCPTCGMNADKLMGGDHGGDCQAAVSSPRSAAGIIRHHALLNGSITANDVRAAMDQAGIPGPSRGPAFATAERKGWIVRDGYVPSTDAATKAHPVARYTSLIYVAPRSAA